MVSSTTACGVTQPMERHQQFLMYQAFYEHDWLEKGKMPPHPYDEFITTSSRRHSRSPSPPGTTSRRIPSPGAATNRNNHHTPLSPTVPWPAIHGIATSATTMTTASRLYDPINATQVQQSTLHPDEAFKIQSEVIETERYYQDVQESLRSIAEHSSSSFYPLENNSTNYGSASTSVLSQARGGLYRGSHRSSGFSAAGDRNKWDDNVNHYGHHSRNRNIKASRSGRNEDKDATPLRDERNYVASSECNNSSSAAARQNDHADDSKRSKHSSTRSKNKTSSSRDSRAKAVEDSSAHRLTKRDRPSLDRNKVESGAAGAAAAAHGSRSSQQVDEGQSRRNKGDQSRLTTVADKQQQHVGDSRSKKHKSSSDNTSKKDSSSRREKTAGDESLSKSSSKPEKRSSKQEEKLSQVMSDRKKTSGKKSASSSEMHEKRDNKESRNFIISKTTKVVESGSSKSKKRAVAPVASSGDSEKGKQSSSKKKVSVHQSGSSDAETPSQLDAAASTSSPHVTTTTTTSSEDKQRVEDVKNGKGSSLYQNRGDYDLDQAASVDAIDIEETSNIKIDAEDQEEVAVAEGKSESTSVSHVEVHESLKESTCKSRVKTKKTVKKISDIEAPKIGKTTATEGKKAAKKGRTVCLKNDGRPKRIDFPKSK